MVHTAHSWISQTQNIWNIYPNKFHLHTYIYARNNTHTPTIKLTITFQWFNDNAPLSCSWFAAITFPSSIRNRGSWNKSQLKCSNTTCKSPLDWYTNVVPIGLAKNPLMETSHWSNAPPLSTNREYPVQVSSQHVIPSTDENQSESKLNNQYVQQPLSKGFGYCFCSQDTNGQYDTYVLTTPLRSDWSHAKGTYGMYRHNTFMFINPGMHLCCDDAMCLCI